VYKVFTKLGDGKWMYVATREDLDQAVQLVESLNASWPREYVVRDSQGNGVTFGHEQSMHPEHRSMERIT
jgi:hypothetical protein